MANEKIMLVEDDPDIQSMVRKRLEREGFSIFTYASAEEALRAQEGLETDVILLDIMLAGMDGFEACRQFRKRYQTPIIFLSSKDSAEDKIIGLTLGANDYVSKPFSMGELLARIRVQLRLGRKMAKVTSLDASPFNQSSLLLVGPLKIDSDRHQVYVKDRLVNLTHTEFKILRLLASHPQHVFSNAHIFQSVWGYDSAGDARTIMVHISNLRKKIEEDPIAPTLIQTIKGVGYKLEAKARS